MGGNLLHPFDIKSPLPSPSLIAQVRELCALHALNNVLQRREFSEKQLDAICDQLAPGSWLNPHRSLLGTGNFDVNVLMTALQLRGRDARWFDRRRWGTETFGNVFWKMRRLVGLVSRVFICGG